MKLRVLSSPDVSTDPTASAGASAEAGPSASSSSGSVSAHLVQLPGGGPLPTDAQAAFSIRPTPDIRTPGEFRAWVHSWIALSRLYNYHDEDPGKCDPEEDSQPLLSKAWRKAKGVGSSTIRRSIRRYPVSQGATQLTDMPPEILHQITSYLSPRDLAALLQTPSNLISAVAQTAISRRRHTITCLANLHTFLAYGGQSPLFYRTATMMLFGRHFVRLVPEAKNLLGFGYAVILAWFMALFYTVPFLLVIAIYLMLDLTTLMTRTTASLLLHTSPIATTCHFPSFFRTPPRTSYTHTVRDLSFSGTTDPSTPTRGLLNPWASHLYLLTNCCPNLHRLHLVGCSLAWWFRLAPLGQLKELVLEGCELDETGLEILAESCGKGIRKLTFVGGEVRGGETPDETMANAGGGVMGTQIAAPIIAPVLPSSGASSTVATARSSVSPKEPAPPPTVIFPQLTHIAFRSRTQIDMQGLKLVLDRAPNLKSISYSVDCSVLNATCAPAAALVGACASPAPDGIPLITIRKVDSLRLLV